MGGSGTFSMVVIDSRGCVRDWSATANTEAEARCLAIQEGFTVLDVKQAGSKRSRRLRLSSSRLDPVSFAQDLSTLLDAGISIRQSIQTLARRAGSARYRGPLARLEELISHGMRLSDALEATGVFTPLLVATVAASEQTGDVATGLARYAKHQERLRALRDRVIGACVYPLLLLVVGSIVLLVLLGVVVPRFAQVIDVQGHDLPFASKILIGWGSFANTHPSAPLGVLMAFIAVASALFYGLRSPATRRSILETLPFVQAAAREFQHLQMYRTAAILTSRGIPIHKALGYTTDYLSTSGKTKLQVSLEEIKTGVALSVALSSSGLVDDMASSMLAVAEQSGAMPEMLDRIADFYERSLQRNVEIATRLVEPILMIVFGVLIGGIVLLMYLPIFDLASSVS